MGVIHAGVQHLPQMIAECSYVMDVGNHLEIKKVKGGVMEIYILYDKKQNLLIARMRHPDGSDKFPLLGAIDTNNNWHLNSMRSVIVGKKESNRAVGGVIPLGEWWGWFTENEGSEYALIHAEFPFDPADVEVRAMGLLKADDLCACCDEVFEKRRRDQIYCGKPCRQKACRRRKKK